MPKDYNVQVTITTVVFVRDGKVTGTDTVDGWEGDSLYVEAVDPETGDAEEIYPLSDAEARALTRMLGKWETKVIQKY